jgi:hypothetical protein
VLARLIRDVASHRHVYLNHPFDYLLTSSLLGLARIEQMLGGRSPQYRLPDGTTRVALLVAPRRSLGCTAIRVSVRVNASVFAKRSLRTPAVVPVVGDSTPTRGTYGARRNGG